jgi:hypothetical protein
MRRARCKVAARAAAKPDFSLRFWKSNPAKSAEIKTKGSAVEKNPTAWSVIGRSGVGEWLTTIIRSRNPRRTSSSTIRFITIRGIEIGRTCAISAELSLPRNSCLGLSSQVVNILLSIAFCHPQFGHRSTPLLTQKPALGHKRVYGLRFTGCGFRSARLETQRFSIAQAGTKRIRHERPVRRSSESRNPRGDIERPMANCKPECANRLPWNLLLRGQTFGEVVVQKLGNIASQDLVAVGTKVKMVVLEKLD